jgi:hypothetical protein
MARRISAPGIMGSVDERVHAGRVALVTATGRLNGHIIGLEQLEAPGGAS